MTKKIKNRLLIGVGILIALVIAWNMGPEPVNPLNTNPGVEATANKESLEEVEQSNNQIKDAIAEEDQVEDASTEDNNDKLVEAEIDSTLKEESEEVKETKETKDEKNENQSKDQLSSEEESKETVEEVSSQEIESQEPSESEEDPIKEPQVQEKDQYMTEPTPEGKPKPVEPQDVVVDKSESFQITLSVSCETLLNNMALLDETKHELVPEDGWIFKEKQVTVYQGESVLDVLLREMQNNKIHMEYVNTPMYNSAYIEGINNLYELDAGELSGWMYKVNGWFPNYGCSRYQLQPEDKVEWVYTCDLGRDVGGSQAIAQ